MLGGLLKGSRKPSSAGKILISWRCRDAGFCLQFDQKPPDPFDHSRLFRLDLFLRSVVSPDRLALGPMFGVRRLRQKGQPSVDGICRDARPAATRFLPRPRCALPRRDARE